MTVSDRTPRSSDLGKAARPPELLRGSRATLARAALERTRKGLRPWLTALVALVLGSVATFAAAEPQFPAQNGTRVVDDAGILSDATEHDLDVKLKTLEDATTDQVVVVTVKDLGGYEISDYGYQLGRKWGVGQSGKVAAADGLVAKDNGLLLIVAPNDHKVRIEVGYGLEGVMTDAMSSIIIRNAIIPSFKAGDYEAGVVKGTDAIVTQLSMDRQEAIQKAQAAQQQADTRPHDGRLPLPVIILIIVFIIFFSRGWLPWLILGNVLGGGGRGGWGGGGGWSGGGGGGGFSGGGGSFGGGGSSGSW